MAQADDGEYGHAAIEYQESATRLRLAVRTKRTASHDVADDDAEADAEQNREDGVELSVDKHVEQEA